MFGQEDSTWVVIGAVVVAALLFVLGLYCLRKDKDKNNKKKGKIIWILDCLLCMAFWCFWQQEYLFMPKLMIAKNRKGNKYGCRIVKYVCRSYAFRLRNDSIFQN